MYQRSVPALNALATAPRGDGVTYGDAVHFVHVYVVEPHPSLPDVSPYTGRKAENDFSCPQARTYEERVAMASLIADTLEGAQLLLVDGLGIPIEENAVWCTYGPAPNSAWIIDRTGVVRFSQLWANAADLRAEIDRMIDG